MTKTKTKVKDKFEENLTETLNRVPVQDVSSLNDDRLVADFLTSTSATSLQSPAPGSAEPTIPADQQAAERTVESEDEAYAQKVSEAHSKAFDSLDEKEFKPRDYQIGVPVDSLESPVGYTSLVRLMQEAFYDRVAFLRSEAGGSLSADEARQEAFHACRNEEEAKQLFENLMSRPLHSLDFNSLGELYAFAPRVAERLWEKIKDEGRMEFESGHLAANTMFPAAHMKQAWDIARYLGIRDSFIDDWNPQGGIEVAMIDMLAQSYFQWQYWLEQVVLRSETRPREEHPEYVEWKQWNEERNKAQSWSEGHWFPPYVSEQQAIEHAVQMADRFNRIFMRTLRQLRDLRRYSPVTINNPNQVNIAASGGQQVNLSNTDDLKKLTASPDGSFLSD